jgi:hypothetical protein
MNAMTYVTRIAAITLAGLLSTACATVTHESSKANSAEILADGAASQSSNQAAMAGRTAMAYGDAWTATRLFKRASAAHPSPLNRFNEAAGLENTGRLSDAAVIYRTLLVDGKYTWANSNRDLNNSKMQMRRFNIADESQRRLIEISLAKTSTKTAGGEAILDANVGGDSAAKVGGPTSGAVSDEHARQLDVKADARRPDPK